MTVGILRIHLAVPAATLKEKRTIVRSTIERVRRRYNVAMAEVEDLDDPGHATLGAACVSNEAAHADSQLQAVANAIETARLDVEVLSIETELVHT